MTTFFFVVSLVMLLWNLRLAAEKRRGPVERAWRDLDRGPRVIP